MNPLALAVLALAALPAVACCTPEPKTPAAASPAPAPAPAKVEAPVGIDATLGDGTARVTVRFTSPATAVRVEVSGVDGLVVKGPSTLVEGASFDRGAEAAFDVAFTPGPGRSQLAVVVSGAFGGGHRAMVRSFALGTPSPAQEKAAGRVVETPEGERVKIVVPGQ